MSGLLLTLCLALGSALAQDAVVPPSVPPPAEDAPKAAEAPVAEADTCAILALQ